MRPSSSPPCSPTAGMRGARPPGATPPCSPLTPAASWPSRWASACPFSCSSSMPGRCGAGPLARAWEERARLLAEKLPLLLLAGLAAALAVQSQHDWGALRDTARFPHRRPDRKRGGLLRHLRCGASCWPDDLAIYYPHRAASSRPPPVGVWPPPSGGHDAPLACCAAAALPHAARGLALVRARARPGHRAGADRRARRWRIATCIWPIVGPLVALVWLVAELAPRRLAHRRRRGARRWPPALRRAQALTLRDSLTVFTHAIAVTTPNPVAQNNAGCALLEAGRTRDAAAHLHRAVALQLPHRAELERSRPRRSAARPHHRRASSATAPRWSWSRRIANASSSPAACSPRTACRRQAETMFLRLKQVAPELPQPYAELGALYASTEPLARSRRAWRSYLRLRPADAGIQARLRQAEICTPRSKPPARSARADPSGQQPATSRCAITRRRRRSRRSPRSSYASRKATCARRFRTTSVCCCASSAFCRSTIPRSTSQSRASAASAPSSNAFPPFHSGRAAA